MKNIDYAKELGIEQLNVQQLCIISEYEAKEAHLLACIIGPGMLSVFFYFANIYVFIIFLLVTLSSIAYSLIYYMKKQSNIIRDLKAAIVMEEDWYMK